MLVVLFLAVIYTDFRWLRIPNVFTYPAMLIGLALSAFEAVPGAFFVNGPVDHVAALVIAFGLAYPFYIGGGLKAGDAKLLMAIGAVRGTGFLLVSATYGALIGGVIAVGVILYRRFARPMAGAEAATMRTVMKSSMPYGVALGLGGLITVALEAASVIRVGGA